MLFRHLTVGAGLEFPDEQLHWQLASNLVHQGNLVSDDGRWAARMPLYPLFLAPFSALGDAGPLLARFAQALVGAATALIAFRWVWRAARPPAAWIAGVLIALDPFGVFFSQLLLTETVFTFLAVAFGAATWAVLERPERRAPVVWLALVAAALPMTRPSSAAWVPCVLILLLILDRNRARAARRATAVVLMVACALIPWAVRNRAVIGAPAWLSSNGGVTLYDALGPQADGSSNQAFMSEIPELAGLGEAERDRWLRDAAIREIRANPGRVLRLAAVKLARFWNPFPNYDAYSGGWRAWVGAGYSLFLYVSAAVGAAVALGLVRASESARSARILALVAVVPIVYFTAVHAVYIGSVRYRLPLVPLLAILAALGISAMARRGSPSANSPPR